VVIGLTLSAREVRMTVQSCFAQQFLWANNILRLNESIWTISCSYFESWGKATPTLYLNGVLLSRIHSLEELLAAVVEAGASLKPDSHEQKSWLKRLRDFRPGMTRLNL
jgi:hypothetical protein